MARKRPDPTDVSVGNRIRFLRTKAGLSQEEVGNALDMTFQQIQKYEKGTNRCAPSRLIVMARLFKVPVADFFDDVDKTGNGKGVDYAGLLATRNRQEIFQRLTKLDDGAVEAAVLQLLNRMSA